MPNKVPSSLTTGRPEMRKRAHRSSTSWIVMSGFAVTGSVTMPDSERLTISTCSACSCEDKLRCKTPMPPWRAMAIAMRASVTVSIAADAKGIPKRVLRVNCAEVSTSDGTTLDSAGSSSTSSNVKPCNATLFGSSPPVETRFSVITGLLLRTRFSFSLP